MRALTLGQVRELLSGSAATSFVEAWTRASQARLSAREQLEDLRSQILAAESRVKAAEAVASTSSARAAALRSRAAPLLTDPQVRGLAERETAALIQAASAREAEARDEASERRNRALQMAGRVQQLEQMLEQQEEEREHLLREAARLGGYVGESCLFFGDADRTGGAFLVPLETLDLEGVELPAFVLHRLPPGVSLDRAEAIRDEPDETSGSDESTEDDPFAAPSERQPVTGKKRKKEKT